jgi:ABC-type transporter Mla subunit MlaD
MTITTVIRRVVTLGTRTIDAALALPRIALALERIADATDDVRRLADVTPALETIGGLAADARRLLGDPARYEELLVALAAIVRLGEAAATIGPLGDAVRQLNTAAAALSTTVTPLQGASERLGRFVDRFPATKSRAATDADLG